MFLPRSSNSSVVEATAIPTYTQTARKVRVTVQMCWADSLIEATSFSLEVFAIHSSGHVRSRNKTKSIDSRRKPLQIAHLSLSQRQSIEILWQATGCDSLNAGIAHVKLTQSVSKLGKPADSRTSEIEEDQAGRDGGKIPQRAGIAEVKPLQRTRQILL